MKILYVEDRESFQDLAKLALEVYLGQNVTFANNAFEGMAKLKKERYDLIITDWTMPVADGGVLLLSLKENNITTPVAIVTAHDEVECRQFDVLGVYSKTRFKDFVSPYRDIIEKAQRWIQEKASQQ